MRRAAVGTATRCADASMHAPSDASMAVRHGRTQRDPPHVSTRARTRVPCSCELLAPILRARALASCLLLAVVQMVRARAVPRPRQRRVALPLRRGAARPRGRARRAPPAAGQGAKLPLRVRGPAALGRCAQALPQTRLRTGTRARERSRGTLRRARSGMRGGGRCVVRSPSTRGLVVTHTHTFAPPPVGIATRAEQSARTLLRNFFRPYNQMLYERLPQLKIRWPDD